LKTRAFHAVSPDFGEYKYEAILQKLGSYGFTVISEQRPKNTDAVKYAGKVIEQVAALLNFGVPAKNITVVGASKGSGIVIVISHRLENEEINFAILGTCSPGDIKFLRQNDIFLHGNVLAIRDSLDDLSGSCQELFAFSSGRGLARHAEIVLHVGTGHGILYQPLDEWLLPVVQWAGGE
jgi:hypothetical protein